MRKRLGKRHQGNIGSCEQGIHFQSYSGTQVSAVGSHADERICAVKAVHHLKRGEDR